ncbi:MAG: SPOR domain-containing protein [Roseobacter sp.]
MYPKGGEALMAEVEFSHDAGVYEYGAGGSAAAGPSGYGLTNMTNIAGAAVSLALIAGVGVWGYDLMMRDVTGIPVVRAADAEMRVRPEDPGGQLAQHQGLAVNEIAARGAASGPVDQVLLAPPDVALADDDQPIVKVAAPVTLPAPLAPATQAFNFNAGAQGKNAAQVLSSEDIDSLVAELIGDADTAGGPKVVQARQRDEATAGQPAVGVEEPASQIVDAPGLRTSMRPKLRPSDIQALIRPASYTPPAAKKDIDPAAIPSGTRLAQLGAFDSADVARTEWDKMQTRFGEILSGKSRVVQQAQSGGRTFYRLRAMGFVDLNDTRRFCSAVKAEGVDCIPVQVK